MSYTFSRRAFLKYSAATAVAGAGGRLPGGRAASAVAVAGASLLGGCEYQDPNNPVSKALPSAITSELQVIGGLRGLKIENGTCTMEVYIESGRANPIPLDPYRFSLAIKDAEGKQVYFSGNNGGVKITDAENSLIVKKTPVTLHLEAAKVPDLQDGYTVVFKYMPIRENSEYSMTWEITKEVYDKALAEAAKKSNG